ncbi:uncharacterized protein LOC133913084 [Phragmites australis]|uniref:uncharacterized protein LOC133913084 n=1 Tax=Phragmites australis TaxID=29695 RepID=UPI002D791352|nr:uncharacterized protein LOC133913084 [Phragmites australis]
MATMPWALPVRRLLQEGYGASYAQHGAARSTTMGRSVETLVVIVAAIVLAAVLAGVLARVCGGQHMTPNADDRDVEGWVERRCRSCLDSGLPALQQQGSSKTGEIK